VNEQAEGLGIYIHADGKEYKGEWKDDKYHGGGRLILPSGEIYEGLFEYGF